jgi:hypothetical protein
MRMRIKPKGGKTKSPSRKESPMIQTVCDGDGMVDDDEEEVSII